MKRFALTFALVASFAYAVAPAPTLDPAPGSFIGQKTSITNPMSVAVTVNGNSLIKLNAAVSLGVGESLPLIWDGTNWIGVGFKPGQGSIVFDFPALSVDEPCEDSSSTAVLGAVIGDGCAASSNLGSDGGATLPDNARLSCEFTATSVGKVRLCTIVQTDGGGAFNLHDAGFYLRAIK